MGFFRKIYKAITAPTPPPVTSKRPESLPEKMYLGHTEVVKEGDPRKHMDLDSSPYHTWTSPYYDNSRRMCSTCGRHEKVLYYHPKTGEMK